MMWRTFLTAFSVMLLILASGCYTTYVIMYPSAEDLFITSGDDPGTESEESYIPKGQYIHTTTAYYLPIPFLGLIDLVKADPATVYEKHVIPEVRAMGGDALINARVEYTPPPHKVLRIFSNPFSNAAPEQTKVYGTVVKRPGSRMAPPTIAPQTKPTPEDVVTQESRPSAEKTGNEKTDMKKTQSASQTESTKNLTETLAKKGQTVKVTTKQNELIHGTFVGENAHTVFIRTDDGRVIKLPRQWVVELKIQ